MPAETVYQFYGVDINEADEIVKQEALKRTQQSAFNATAQSNGE